MSKGKFHGDKIIVLLLIMGATSILMMSFITYSTVDYVTAIVTDKERVFDGESSRYLIFTEEETFENVDSALFFKFNSSDVYGKIKKGGVYKFKVSGWRISVVSSYRNIISMEEVQGEEE
jgi:hypothetical protein